MIVISDQSHHVIGPTDVSTRSTSPIRPHRKKFHILLASLRSRAIHNDPLIRILRPQPLSIPLGANHGLVRMPVERKEGMDGFLHLLQALRLEHAVQD